MGFGSFTSEDAEVVYRLSLYYIFKYIPLHNKGRFQWSPLSSLDSNYTFYKIFANTLKHKIHAGKRITLPPLLWRELLLLTLVLCLIVSYCFLLCENSVQMFTGWGLQRWILKIQNISSYLSWQVPSSVSSNVFRSTRFKLVVRNSWHVWSAFEYLLSSSREKLPACWLVECGSLP